MLTLRADGMGSILGGALYQVESSKGGGGVFEWGRLKTSGLILIIGNVA